MIGNKTKTEMLDKMLNVKEDSQKLGEFIDWLRSKEILLCSVVANPSLGETWVPIGESIEQLLARYFEIDLVEMENERIALLRELREKQ